MKSLLLVAHGSRVQSSNEEIAALSDKLRERLKGRFDHVSCAFLEIAQPDIPSGLAACVAAGASEIVVLPYFLAAGRHINEDIPREVAKCDHPDVPIRICDHIGGSAGMPELLVQAVC